jgi:hypothetical protein
MIDICYSWILTLLWLGDDPGRILDGVGSATWSASSYGLLIPELLVHPCLPAQVDTPIYCIWIEFKRSH